MKANSRVEGATIAAILFGMEGGAKGAGSVETILVLGAAVGVATVLVSRRLPAQQAP